MEEAKMTNPAWYLAHLLMMLRAAELLSQWNRETGEELEKNLANDISLDPHKRAALSAFVGALNAASGHSEKLVTLDLALRKALASLGVGAC